MVEGTAKELMKKRRQIKNEGSLFIQTLVWKGKYRRFIVYLFNEIEEVVNSYFLL
jgi:hypothetical protein